jgi:hypothetical protein
MPPKVKYSPRFVVFIMERKWVYVLRFQRYAGHAGISRLPNQLPAFPKIKALEQNEAKMAQP